MDLQFDVMQWELASAEDDIRGALQPDGEGSRLEVADDFHVDLAADEDFDLERLQRRFPAPRPAARRPVQTDDWCVAALAPGQPLCSCCAASALA
jgi:hypothetical protein